jgi:hypothetical protein
MSSQGHMGIGAAEEIAEWCLARMDQETRGRLMAERPTLYAEIYPDVDASVIVAKVAGALGRRCSTCHRTAHTPESTSYHGHAYTA